MKIKVPVFAVLIMNSQLSICCFHHQNNNSQMLFICDHKDEHNQRKQTPRYEQNKKQASSNILNGNILTANLHVPEK